MKDLLDNLIALQREHIANTQETLPRLAMVEVLVLALVESHPDRPALQKAVQRLIQANPHLKTAVPKAAAFPPKEPGG